MTNTEHQATIATALTQEAPGRDAEGAILEAARDLIAAGGVESLSMRGVAERVGLSATAIYHHFANKQELVDRVVRGAYERFGAYMEEAARRHPQGSFDRVRALGEAYLTFALEHAAYFRVIFSIAVPNPRALEDLPGGAGYPLLRQCVTDAMESGAMRRADPDVTAHYLWAVVHGVLTLVLSCRLQDCPACAEGEGQALELFRAFAPFVQHGVAGPGGAS
jgi:AcrR family transcriptional regulator